MTFKKNTKNVIFGNSGVWKATLLNICGLIDKPNQGKVILNNEEINYNNNLSDIRLLKIGFIFQKHYLLPEYSVKENLMLPSIIANKNHNETFNRIDEYLDSFKLSKLKEKYPNEISVGESQRIAVIRAIMNNPDIIIADEPTANLDEENTEILLSHLDEINRDNNSLFIIATHDKSFLKISDNNYKLSDKKLIKL